MTNRFYRSRMNRKKISFILQIGNYSKFVCKGHYSSPEFGDGESEGNKWSLLVHLYDGADHLNFIDVRLKREDYAAEELFVKVDITIMNAFGLRSLTNEKEILFRDSNEARILAMAKEQLKGYLGLKKFFYLPKDTLTLKCNLMVYENRVSSYMNESYFQCNIPDAQEYFSENFVHSRLVEAASDYFMWEIRDFSAHSYGGRTNGPEYQSERLGGKWSLIVCSATGYNSEESMDIRLVRRDSYENQLVKAKLSIIDNEGEVVLSGEKHVYFTSPRDVQLLTFTQKDISGWFGHDRNELIPNDTLTLRCEMVLYEEVNDNFSRKNDFEKSIKTYGYTPMHFMPFLPLIFIILFVGLHIFYSLCSALLWFIWCTFLDILEAAKMFLIAVTVIVILFNYIKYKAENIRRKEKADEIKRKLREQKLMKEYDEFIRYGARNQAKKQFYANKKPKYYGQYTNY